MSGFCAACVVGLGQDTAGDDAVGLAVVDRLAADGVPEEVELRRAGDPSVLLELLADRRPVVVVDAVLGGAPGRVLELSPEDLATGEHLPLSTHTISVAQAIELARALQEAPLAPFCLIGVTVERPRPQQRGLSAAVAAAVPCAAERVRALVTSRAGSEGLASASLAATDSARVGRC